MNEEYQYEIDKYIVGVDKGNSDEIGLTVGYLENEEFYIIGSCYGEQARFIDLLIKQNTELKEENFKLQARADKYECRINKVVEYIEKRYSIPTESDLHLINKIDQRYLLSLLKGDKE